MHGYKWPIISTRTRSVRTKSPACLYGGRLHIPLFLRKSKRCCLNHHYPPSTERTCYRLTVAATRSLSCVLSSCDTQVQFGATMVLSNPGHGLAESQQWLEKPMISAPQSACRIRKHARLRSTYILSARMSDDGGSPHRHRADGTASGGRSCSDDRRRENNNDRYIEGDSRYRASYASTRRLEAALLAAAPSPPASRRPQRAAASPRAAAVAAKVAAATLQLQRHGIASNTGPSIRRWVRPGASTGPRNARLDRQWLHYEAVDWSKSASARY